MRVARLVEFMGRLGKKINLFSEAFIIKVRL